MAFASGSAVPDAIRGLLGIERPLPGAGQESPSWKGRVKEAAYTSPKGTRVVFSYESVSREVTKRTAAFEFPGVNDAYVQDNGFGARRYPVRAIFWGENCDLIASAFEAALLEPGKGRLEHPLYGTFDVTPFGDITRRDDLKESANETIVEVTFWTTTGAVYPAAGVSQRSEILAALDGFNVAASNEFLRTSHLASTVAKANMKTKVRAILQKASSTLSSVAAVNTAVIKDFRDAQSAINFGLDVLVGQPLQLALQMSNMIQAPARALAGIESRLAAYSSFGESVFNAPESSGAYDDTTIARVRLKLSNDFAMDDVSASSAVSGSALSIVETDFETKPQALAAAESLLDQFDAVVEWRETRFAGLGIIDTGESYQALQQLVAQVSGYVIEISSTLVPERRVVLDRARTIVDVAAELYGSIDDRLDFLIASNNLSGDQILELPRGTVVRYYA